MSRCPYLAFIDMQVYTHACMPMVGGENTYFGVPFPLPAAFQEFRISHLKISQLRQLPPGKPERPSGHLRKEVSPQPPSRRKAVIKFYAGPRPGFKDLQEDKCQTDAH